MHLHLNLETSLKGIYFFNNNERFIYWFFKKIFLVGRKTPKYSTLEDWLNNEISKY